MYDPERMAYARARVWQNREMQDLQRFVDAYFVQDGNLREVLDAGAGYELPIDIPLNVRLTAIDIAEDALAKNANADKRIVGDLQTYPFPPNTFDAVICWWVLEHLPAPAQAIQNLAAAIRPGGLLVVGIPYLWGFKGIATKLTPYFFHAWMYQRASRISLSGTKRNFFRSELSLRNLVAAVRWIIHTQRHGGTPGRAPYRTFLHPSLAPRRLASIARANRLELVYSRAYSSNAEDTLPLALKYAWRTLDMVARAVTLGRYKPSLSERIMVFRKSTELAYMR